MCFYWFFVYVVLCTGARTYGVGVYLNDNITPVLPFFIHAVLTLFCCYIFQPQVEHVVETQPNVHYLIDFEDGQGDDVDQVDRFDFPNISILRFSKTS